MKCSACGKSYALSMWRTINIGNMTKTTVSKNTNRDNTPVSYYSFGNGNRANQYNMLYACPHCGTVRIKTPIDKV